MKLIIPMAGMGKRMRPHTLTVPKPLLPIAGISIVERLVEEIASLADEKLDEIAFIIGDFGNDVEEQLLAVAERFNSVAKIYYQNEALGTAHAIHCAAPSLKGNVIVAFADTLFKADFDFDKQADSVIFVNQVDNPQAFGVVKLSGDTITDFVEKPAEFVSDLAIIGIYYFRDGENLAAELKYLLDNKVLVNGEYQLTDALENMKNKHLVFKPGKVNEWLDCGNKDATVYTNQRILSYLNQAELVHEKATIVNSQIIEPSFIAEGAEITNSVVGPYASVGKNSRIVSSVIKNSIVQENTLIENAVLNNSMLGNFVSLQFKALDLSIGDYSTLKY